MIIRRADNFVICKVKQTRCHKHVFAQFTGWDRDSSMKRKTSGPNGPPNPKSPLDSTQREFSSCQVSCLCAEAQNQVKQHSIGDQRKLERAFVGDRQCIKEFASK
ncbi:unnamed protein product [Sphagnum jensenii]|uniref:Uncharacterized protein n=1 Tax=Sphagnum jensenii TaxID=128206 RepID=A0ABP0VSJ6_9BRYO